MNCLYNSIAMILKGSSFHYRGVSAGKHCLLLCFFTVTNLSLLPDELRINLPDRHEAANEVSLCASFIIPCISFV